MRDIKIIKPSKGQNYLLSPLLEDRQAQKTAYRLRNNRFVFQSIHNADVEEALLNGWVVQRRWKKKTRVKKEKSHDKWLEDRVWCLLYKMSYEKLNGEPFTIQFERDNGSIGRKQIDVFACDKETSFVIECKSEEERGRRSLQEDIQETISLQNYIRSSIFHLYGKRPKPKIIWVYATHNIIWSESDVAQAFDGGISIVTENELQYFAAFIKHMGPAGKYQVLGEFLKGQKIPGLGEVKIPAIRGRIGGETFFNFVVTPRRLLKIAFINHQALNHPDGRPAYQRMISSPRIKEIGKFITAGGYFPTNIIANFIESPKFEFISNKENTDPNIKFGWITLPTKYRSAWIIDGQHRLYGYSHLDDKFLDQSLLMLVFEKMDTRKEADLFITINHKQKSVPKSLLVSLLADIRMGDSDPSTALSAIASGVARALNTDMTSPFLRRFSIPGVPSEPNQNLTASEVVNGLRRSCLIGKISGKTLLAGPLSGQTDIQTIERARRVLNGYFERLRSASPDRWEKGKPAFIAVNPGIRAHLMLIAEIVSYLTHKRNIDFCLLAEDKFIAHLNEIAEPVFDFIGSASDDVIRFQFSRKFGEGGVREYTYSLLKLIHDKRKDFGSEEFLRWVSQSESEKIEEANQFLMKLSEQLTNYVIQTLKKVHGTLRLESGEQAFWEIGVESERIQKNAFKKQREDKTRRKPKEAYLDILDLADIVKQPNNWPHFEHVFKNPKPGEKKGQKYYVTWVYDFNELRNIAAHKNQLKTYTDDDLELIDWLRAEVEPKVFAETT